MHSPNQEEKGARRLMTALLSAPKHQEEAA